MSCPSSLSFSVLCNMRALVTMVTGKAAEGLFKKCWDWVLENVETAPQVAAITNNNGSSIHTG